MQYLKSQKIGGTVFFILRSALIIISNKTTDVF